MPRFKKNSKVKENIDLPISKYKNEILTKLSTNQVLIITGETGCGKSTQIPKYLHEQGYTRNKKIVCLHPRCVAATSLAERVANELHTNVGKLVGYRIRFDNRYDRNYTKIIFMATGFMVKLIMDDKRSNKKGEEYFNNWANNYSVIILDEAHERSIQMDIMLGKMKEVLNVYPIKLIIMSATINTEQFKEYYPNCEIVRITEKMSSVNVIYRPLKSQNYMKEITSLVKEILENTKKGDILIFLQTELKVRKCRKFLKNLKNTRVLKFFANMDYDDKLRVFDDFSPIRKIIIATNIAETSLTIPGVDFVIDSGAVKRISFDHETWIEKWVSTYISITEADQRKGRTGRTGPGCCYRLYKECFIRETDENEEDESIYDIKFPFYCCKKEINYETNKRFHKFPLPEILQANLGNMILILKSLGINNIMRFPFIVYPNESHVESAIDQLTKLSLLDRNTDLTKLGNRVSFLPLEPRLGKVVCIGSSYKCSRDILVIVAMISVRHVLKFSKKSNQVYKAFFDPDGDFFRLLHVYNEGEYHRFDKMWCKDNCISHYGILYANKVFNQLARSVGHLYSSVINYDEIKEVFYSGFFLNTAKPNGNFHEILTGKEASVHRQSCLYRTKEIVLYQTVHTSMDENKLFLRNCIVLDKDLSKNTNLK